MKAYPKDVCGGSSLPFRKVVVVLNKKDMAQHWEKVSATGAICISKPVSTAKLEQALFHASAEELEGNEEHIVEFQGLSPGGPSHTHLAVTSTSCNNQRAINQGMQLFLFYLQTKGHTQYR